MCGKQENQRIILVIRYFQVRVTHYQRCYQQSCQCLLKNIHALNFEPCENTAIPYHPALKNGIKGYHYYETSGDLLNPISYKQVCIPGTLIIPVRRKNNFLTVVRKHRKSIEYSVVGNPLQARAIKINHVQVEFKSS